jgi:hypothetical protein
MAKNFATAPESAHSSYGDRLPRGADLNQYRSLNRAAVGSVVLLGLALTGLIFPWLVILPIAGVLLGISAVRNIRRYPDEYTGLRLAQLGLLGCLAMTASTIGYHSYVYVTELPPGHTRVSFSELQPENRMQANVIPKRAVKLRGEKIFIKGYIHPGVSGMDKVDQFVLVPDMGTCCFGGQPAPTDMILVRTTRDARVSYGTRPVKLAGVFDVGPQQNFGEVKNVLYRLEAYKPPTK